MGQHPEAPQRLISAGGVGPLITIVIARSYGDRIRRCEGDGMTRPTILPAALADARTSSGCESSRPLDRGHAAEVGIVISILVLAVLAAVTLGPAGVVALVPGGMLIGRWTGRRAVANDRGRVHTALVERAQIFSWEIDSRTGRIVSLTGNVAEVLGYEPHELEGTDVAEIIDIEEARSVLREEARLGADAERRSIVTARHKAGHVVTLREVRLTPRREGLVRGVSVDISEFADALRFQAEHDAMTGLANRTVVEESINEAVGRSDVRVVLLVADLDRFKGINDTLGHPVGDRLLAVLAERLRESAEDFEVMARIGGDEFAFVAIGDLDEAAAIELARRVHLQLSSPVTLDGLQLAVGASIGVAVSPAHGTTYADLLKHADIASYRAKHSGGGVALYEAVEEASGPGQELLCDTVRALDRGEFELHFQPQVNLDDGRVVCAEGLVRWRHPEHGLLAPADFFTAIEIGGHYHRLTDVMLRQAIEFAARLRAEGHDLYVAVNLGSMSFLDRRLPHTVRRLLEAHGLPGRALTMEVTESDILDEQGRDAPVFRELSAIGVRLSIDDFGTGYSNFTRLRALDVDEVKVDRAFVQGLGETSEDAIIVRATIQLAQLLGLDVVAEGVETPLQLQELRALGCTIAQGFHWSAAVHPDEFVSMLATDPGERMAA